MLTRQLISRTRSSFIRLFSSLSKNYICDTSVIDVYRQDEKFQSIVNRGEHQFFYKCDDHIERKVPSIFKTLSLTSDLPKNPIYLSGSSIPEFLDITRFNDRSKGRFPGLIGFEVTSIRQGYLSCQLRIHEELLAPNGYLHAGVVVTLADTACGYGCVYSKPSDAKSFTTIELKSNFMGTAKTNSVVKCEARLIHGGRTTQVWDAEVKDSEKNKLIAAFRCTELLIY